MGSFAAFAFVAAGVLATATSDDGYAYEYDDKSGGNDDDDRAYEYDDTDGTTTNDNAVGGNDIAYEYDDDDDTSAAGRCDPHPHLIFSSNCYPWGLCAGGVCCDCPSGVALYKSPRFTCKVDTSISGTADVRLSNGKTEDTGFSASKCDSECTSKSACQSFVWKESDGYEL